MNMKEIIFACDLDNTLIHSWKHRREGDLCIEHIGEKEQGYMSPEAVKLYGSLPENVLLVPVTTRSVDQYRRIHWPGNREPELAVTTNGAILLGPRNAQGDEKGFPGKLEAAGERTGNGAAQKDLEILPGMIRQWISESESAAAPLRRTMDELLEILSASGRFQRVRTVDDFYLFVCCEEGQDPMDALPERAFGAGLQVVSSGRKAYLLPPLFSKGEAVRRLKGHLQPAVILAAGDTEIDLSMAEPADRMCIPEKLFRTCGQEMPQRVREKLLICPEGEDFSVFVLREACRCAERM
jgi:hydroxymethylpyrimidine pyrophosphatase-like HAD family hydrolase